jgi:hypothetical protein
MLKIFRDFPQESTIFDSQKDIKYGNQREYGNKNMNMNNMNFGNNMNNNMNYMNMNNKRNFNNMNMNMKFNNANLGNMNINNMNLNSLNNMNNMNNMINQNNMNNINNNRNNMNNRINNFNNNINNRNNNNNGNNIYRSNNFVLNNNNKEPKPILPRSNTYIEVPYFDKGNNGNLINIVFAAGTGLRVNIPVPYNTTVEKLLQIYAKRMGISENVLGTGIIFLYDALYMEPYDKRTIGEVFHDNQCVITVVEVANVKGA